MSTELTTQPQAAISLGTLAAATPAQLLTSAESIATPLAKMIEGRRLFTVTGIDKKTGKERRHVHVEGWTTLAAMLGILPREVAVTEVDGTYTAVVELIRMVDGAILGRASAECGMDENLWASRPRYARRSMAVTRATGKACRMAFSWIMVLAGYDPTPAEEMPEEPRQVSAYATTRQVENLRSEIRKESMPEQRVLEYAKKYVARTKGRTIEEFHDLFTDEINAIQSQIPKMKARLLAEQTKPDPQPEVGSTAEVIQSAVPTSHTGITPAEFIESVKVMNLHQCEHFLTNIPSFLNEEEKGYLVSALDSRINEIGGVI